MHERWGWLTPDFITFPWPQRLTDLIAQSVVPPPPSDLILPAQMTGVHLCSHSRTFTLVQKICWCKNGLSVHWIKRTLLLNGLTGRKIVQIIHNVLLMADWWNSLFCCLISNSLLKFFLGFYFCFHPVNILFSIRWSCGAEQRSASKKQLKRSISQEPSAITSYVMWPIGKRFTSKPRWLEKRYTSIIYGIFLSEYSKSFILYEV